MIDQRYMSDKSDIWGQRGFGDGRTSVILELLLHLKKNFAWIMLQCNKVKDT